MTVYVLGPDLEPVEATHCDLCSPPSYWPLFGPDNITAHVTRDHAGSEAAEVIEEATAR